MQLKSTSSGSAPLEIVALISLLLVPIGPMLALFGSVSDALAAESIARHGLRYAFLGSELGANPSVAVAEAIELLAASWGKEVAEIELRCDACGDGGYLELAVTVGGATAIQSAGIEPW